MKDLPRGRDARRAARPPRWKPSALAGVMLPALLGGCMTQNHRPTVPAGQGRQTDAASPREVRGPASSVVGPAAGQLRPMPDTTRRPPIPPLIARPAVPQGGRTTLAHVSTSRTADPDVGLVSHAQGPHRLSPPDEPVPAGLAPGDDDLRRESSDLAGQTPESIPQAAPPQPIDLPSALRLADGQNPEIGEARVVILAALARRQQAYALLLPTLTAGTNYHDHIGVQQRASGTILPVTEQSLYVGAGAQAIGTSSPLIPGVNIIGPLTDAIYEPLAAQQRVRAVELNASATANSVLLEVARLYLRLLGAQAIYEARRVTATDADGLAASVQVFAATGQGRRSDADRVDAERRLFQADIFRAEELMAVTSARLAERLNLDPAARLQPTTPTLEPIELVDPNLGVEELIRRAIGRRPDLANRRALLAEANYQVKREKSRPWLPTVWISFSGGAFGGGSNLVPPTFSAVAGRTDFDARAYWTLLNFGVGNAALVKQRKAEAGQVLADQVRVSNDIRSEVAAAHARAAALRSRIDVSRRRLLSAEDGLKEDRARLRATLAKPIEALDSLRLLAEARVALIEAITESNQNQFELFVALGSPPPS